MRSDRDINRAPRRPVADENADAKRPEGQAAPAAAPSANPRFDVPVSYAPRQNHDRPAYRPDRPRDERPGQRPWEDRGRDSRPPQERGAQDRPRDNRPRDDRPRQDRPWSDRPPMNRDQQAARGPGPRDERGAMDRPRDDRARPDRSGPGGPRQDRPWADRPAQHRDAYPNQQGGPRGPGPGAEHLRQNRGPLDRPGQDRPRDDRPRDDRPRQDRPWGERPPMGREQSGPARDHGPSWAQRGRDDRGPQDRLRENNPRREYRPREAFGRTDGPYREGPRQDAPPPQQDRPRDDHRRASAPPRSGGPVRIPAAQTGALPRKMPPEDGFRLSKVLSDRGLSSRREADDWIAAGWVTVDGVMAVLGQRVLPEAKIEIDPAARSQQAKSVTIVMNKPIGYVSGQAEDGYEPASVLVTQANLWEEDGSRKPFHLGHTRGLAPAGRLDIDSTGMLVLTQDGRIAKHLIGEESDVEKEYLVRVEYTREGSFPESDLALLQHGLSLDGKQLKPAKVSWANEDQLRFVLREGRKRQIRRMCELVGLTVTGLKRVRIGSVVLGKLPMGQWRYLRDDERF